MKTNKLLKLAVLGLCINTLVACDALEEKLASQTEAQTVPSSIAEIFSNVNQSQNAYASMKPVKPKKSLFVNKAHAGLYNCSSPTYSDICKRYDLQDENGDPFTEYGHDITLTSCEPAENLTLSGSVFVRYNKLGCQLNDEDASISARVNASITGYDAFNISIRSNHHTTYNNVRIPATGDHGSYILTKGAGANDYTFSNTGTHRVGQVLKVGLKGFDISTRTAPGHDFELNIGATTTLNSGRVEVYHNVLDYHAELTASNIVWSGNCSCPSSGSVSGEAFSRSRSIGTMSLEFGATCGKGTFTFRGKEKSVDLDTCYQN